MQTRLRLRLLLVHLCLINGTHVLLQVALIEPLDVLDSIFTRIQLFTELTQLKVLSLKHLIATLPLFEELYNASAQPIKVFKHN